jgi:hypothetical protein
MGCSVPIAGRNPGSLSGREGTRQCLRVVEPLLPNSHNRRGWWRDHRQVIKGIACLPRLRGNGTPSSRSRLNCG